MNDKRFRALVNDLRHQIGVLAREAQQGDEGARRWLISSFPSHLDFFLALWPEIPTKPVRRSGHDNAT